MTRWVKIIVIHFLYEDGRGDVDANCSELQTFVKQQPQGQ